MKIKIPDDDMKPFAIELDKIKFDPANPGEYIKMVSNINQ